MAQEGTGPVSEISQVLGDGRVSKSVREARAEKRQTDAEREETRVSPGLQDGNSCRHRGECTVPGRNRDV